MTKMSTRMAGYLPENKLQALPVEPVSSFLPYCSQLIVHYVNLPFSTVWSELLTAFLNKI